MPPAAAHSAPIADWPRCAEAAAAASCGCSGATTAIRARTERSAPKQQTIARQWQRDGVSACVPDAPVSALRGDAAPEGPHDSPPSVRMGAGRRRRALGSTSARGVSAGVGVSLAGLALHAMTRVREVRSTTRTLVRELGGQSVRLGLVRSLGTDSATAAHLFSRPSAPHGKGRTHCAERLFCDRPPGSGADRNRLADECATPRLTVRCDPNTNDTAAQCRLGVCIDELWRC